MNYTFNFNSLDELFEKNDVKIKTMTKISNNYRVCMPDLFLLMDFY